MHDFMTTPLGELGFWIEDGAVVRVEVNSRKSKNILQQKSERTGANEKIAREFKKQVSEYFLGGRKKFSVPMKYFGTEFQKKVWQALTHIPFGKKIAYKELAAMVGNPRAVRAVGQANNKNPLPILIPCHRVVGAKGDPIGFACGVATQEWLLKHENATMNS